MMFRASAYTVALLYLASLCSTSLAVSQDEAALDKSADFQAEVTEDDIAREMQVDGANDGAEIDPNHALFVWSIVLRSVLGGLGIVGLVLWLFIRYEKKRTAELAVVADELGLRFSAVKDERLLAKLQQFRLFNYGHSRRMKNVMTAETELAKLSIFDYQFTTGGGNHSHTHSHTLFAMESASLELPQFSVSPEGFFDRLGAKLGAQDIDFIGHPEFSSKFVLQSDDESAVRSLFTQPILDLFVAQPGISVESSHGLFTYMKVGRGKPGEVRDFMTEAYAFFNGIQEQTS